MMNEKVDITIGSRHFRVEMEHFLPMEISAIAQSVSDRMEEIKSQHRDMADTARLAILTALSFAGDLEKERRAHETDRRMTDSIANRISESLRDALKADGHQDADEKTDI